MAKSARASRIKKNNQALKRKVFGPVEQARNERLSAKLLELASQPAPPRPEMQVDVEESKNAPESKDSEVRDESAEEADDEARVDADADMEQSSTAPTRSRPLGRNALKKRKAAKLAHIDSKRRKKETNRLMFTSPAQKAARVRQRNQKKRR